MVSTSTASAIIGAPVLTASEDPASQCVWSAETRDKPGINSILVIIDWPGPTEVVRLAQLPSFGIPSQASQQIKDLPAAAAWVQPTAPDYADHVLVVLSGGMRMQVYVVGTWPGEEQTSSAQLGAALLIAKVALANTP